MRRAKFAGIFYQRAISLLDRQIKECFEGEKGPGALPSSKGNLKVNAVIVPHAGYAYSGQAAAWSYKAIAEQGMSDLYIIIAPSHSSSKTALTIETFDMPYGLVRVDQHFARNLIEKGNIKQDDSLFEEEHSIEVQLPFLQYIFKKEYEKLKILPILIGNNITRDKLKKIALDLKETAIDMNKNVTIIISSDFTHQGPNYKYMPFTIDVKENIYKLDEKAINFIKDFNAEGFLDFVNKEMITICGAFPIYLLLNYLKKGKVLLEQYYTSADLDTHSNYKNSVSYASVLFTD
jgi:AmmeMemoRadiSam system protein B